MNINILQFYGTNKGNFITDIQKHKDKHGFM